MELGLSFWKFSAGRRHVSLTVQANGVLRPHHNIVLTCLHLKVRIFVRGKHLSALRITPTTCLSRMITC